MITLTFALPAESSGFVRQLRDRTRTDRNGTETIQGRFGDKEIELIHTGVGHAITQKRLDHYLESVRPALLISSGFAGAARSNYRVGDLILAENFSDTDLLVNARRVLRDRNAHAAHLFTARAVIDAIGDREEVARQHNAIAIDMETETIAQLCAARGVRMLSLRVLSDTPRHPFPLPPQILFDLERQRTDGMRLAGYLITHPMAWPRLPGFARQIQRARRSLTAALVTLLQTPL
jgi:nucleoside phosphorylase